MHGAFKASTVEWSDVDFVKQHKFLQVFEKLKERAEYVITNNTHQQLQMAKADALAAQERHLQASFVKNVWTDVGHSLCCNEDLQPWMQGSAEEFLQQFKGLKDVVLIAESSLGSIVDPLSQPEVTEEFKAEIHNLLKEELRKHKSKILNQMGEFRCSDLQESVWSKCIGRDAMKSSIFNLMREYADCVSEFKKVHEECLTIVSSVPALDEKEHKLLMLCYEIYEEYFLADDELDEEMELCSNRYIEHLFKATENRLVHEVELKRTKVQQKESRLQGFKFIWSPELEDSISSYQFAIRDNRGLNFALNTTSPDSD